MELPNHLEELMSRSPISQADITSFLREMRRTPSGTMVTSKLLAGKIQAPSEAQAIHAFNVLESCLESETEGSIEFRTEIGRYRFLNEIIRILSPKYLGDKTPPPVKDRAVKFLEDAAGSKRKRWFPSEHSKIQAVYQSLIDGGVIKKNPKFPSTEADEEAELQKSIFDRAENAAVLKKLLQSKDPADLQAANRLIKNLVEEESRRIERRAELHSLIDRIETSTSLLTEMLSQRQIDKEIVDELADTCRSLQQKLGGVATETNDETTSLLQASDDLEKTLALYDKRKDMILEDGEDSEENSTGGACGGGDAAAAPTRILSFADELLLSLDLGTTTEDPVLFPSNGEKSSNSNMKNQNNFMSNDADNLLNLDIDLPSQMPLKRILSPSAETEKKNPLDEIGRLSRELMEQGLKGTNSSSCSSDFKRNDKTPLSLMRKSSSTENGFPSTSSDSLPQNKNLLHSQDSSLLDLDILENPSTKSAAQIITGNKTSANLDLRSSEVVKSSPSLLVEIAPKSSSTTTLDSEQIELKQLLNSVKTMDLDKVEPIQTMNPLDLNLSDDENSTDSHQISLTLTFATAPEFPPAVRIGILTLTNKSPTSELQNYVFQIIPPKGLQIKLLAPSAMQLPAWTKKFLPPPVLNQVILMVIPKSLLANASKPKMKFILSYSTDDDTALHNGGFEIPSFD